MAAAKANVYEMVTTRIIEELEKGIIPWEKLWTGIRAGAYNRVSKKPYSMINQMLLKHTGEYATFKQWQDLGGHVKKGEKSEIVVFWKILEKEETDKETGEKEVKKIPMLRYYNVFHISQVEGVKPLERPFAEVEPIAEGDKIIVDYITRETLNARLDNIDALVADMITKSNENKESKTNAELDKELKQKVKEADCPMYAYTPEMLEALIKWNIQNCIANGLQPVIYMTSITDDAAEIEAEAHPLKIEK